MQARVSWVLIILGTQVIKKKRPVRHVFLDYLSVSYDYALTNITNTKIFFLQMLLLAPASLALMGLLGQKLLPKVGLLGQMELLLTCLLQGALLGLMYSLEQALLEVAGLLKRTLFPRSFLWRMELALKQALLSLIALSGRTELVLTVLTIDLRINFTIGLLGL